MTHAELCIKTANRFVDKVALYEYKSTVSSEEPDVLVFGYSGTILFEIKMSRADFLADAKKPCRKKYKSRMGYEINPNKLVNPEIARAWFRLYSWNPDIFLVQATHLGNERYFVCEAELIKADEVPEGWGLYWFKGGKFYQKKISGRFRSNLKKENLLLVHAMRRHGSGDDTGIIINSYSENKVEVECES